MRVFEFVECHGLRPVGELLGLILLGLRFICLPPRLGRLERILLLALQLLPGYSRRFLLLPLIEADGVHARNPTGVHLAHDL